jgi:hypothetical protein
MTDAERRRRLAAFIRGEIAKPYDWRETNCGAIADRWMTPFLGFSPLARWFGPVPPQDAPPDTNIAVAVNRVMRAGRFRKTSQPQAGDVGLIIHKGRLCIAVLTENNWFSRDASGFIGAPPAAFWKAWRIE